MLWPQIGGDHPSQADSFEAIHICLAKCGNKKTQRTDAIVIKCPPAWVVRGSWEMGTDVPQISQPFQPRSTKVPPRGRSNGVEWIAQRWSSSISSGALQPEVQETDPEWDRVANFSFCLNNTFSSTVAFCEDSSFHQPYSKRKIEGKRKVRISAENRRASQRCCVWKALRLQIQCSSQSLRGHSELGLGTVTGTRPCLVWSNCMVAKWAWAASQWA